MIGLESGMWIATYIVGVLGVFGLLIGSFLNVVVYRVPAGRSIVRPPSACPDCSTEIKPYDNVPVLSWLLLRGKCRECRKPISVRYPLVEAATGVFFALVAWRFWPGAETGRILELVAFLYLAAISVALALIDVDTHRLPNVLVAPSYVVGAVLLAGAGLLAGDPASLLRAALGAVVLFGGYLALALLFSGGMGFGDVKLAGVVGLFLGFLGWGQLIVGAFAAFMIGGVVALILVIVKRADRKSGIPFGPWMLAGCWIGVFFGDSIWSGYLALFGLA